MNFDLFFEIFIRLISTEIDNVIDEEDVRQRRRRLPLSRLLRLPLLPLSPPPSQQRQRRLQHRKLLENPKSQVTKSFSIEWNICHLPLNF